MTTLDDKLLGEKLQYYYSSSEDEDSEKEDGEEAAQTIRTGNPPPAEVTPSSDGSAVNTGPKGVINDWRRFKQLETEKREEQCREMERLIRKLSMSCRSHLDEEADRQKERELREKMSSKLTLHDYGLLHGAPDDEAFLQLYRQQRMEEMRRRLGRGPQFKRVLEIESGPAFLDALEEGHRNTLVVIHIYEDQVPGAEALDGCLLCLAAEYPGVKFCRVRSALLGTSAHFSAHALPALLVYKGGDLVGNFVRITDQLGEDFFAGDLESFLQECGLLPEKEAGVLPAAGNPPSSSSCCFSEEDSDLEID